VLDRPDGAATVFVLGLLGLVVCPFLGLCAWIQGSDYLERCATARLPPEGLAVVGRILGIVSCVLFVLVVAAGVVAGVAAAVLHAG
jgi:hypothetical protein